MSDPATPGAPQPRIDAANGEPDPERNEVALALAAKTDGEAFARLYDLYVGRIYRYCLVRLGERQAAEDATSEVFVHALQSIGGYRGGSFGAWLYRIARNVAADVQRGHRPTEALERASEVPDGSASPEDLAGLTIELEMLRAALALLPEDQRTVLELRAAGWAWQQVGDALGRSPDAARMAGARAFARLRCVRQKANDDAMGAPSHSWEMKYEAAQ